MKVASLDKIGDEVKHIFREHSSEADCVANPGAGERKKVTVEKEKQQCKVENAVRGNFWDGSSKMECKSGGSLSIWCSALTVVCTTCAVSE